MFVLLHKLLKMKNNNTVAVREYINGKESMFYESAHRCYYNFYCGDIDCQDMLLDGGDHVFLFSGLNNANKEFNDWCKKLRVVRGGSVLDTIEQVQDLERFIIELGD